MATQVQKAEAKNAALAYFGAAAQSSSFGFGATLSTPGTGAGAPTGPVIGIGVGARESAGMGVAGEEVVRVYVASKASLPARIPERFGPLPTQVVEVGDVAVTALLTTGQRMGRHRPCSCGVSVGHSNVTAGTLGCRVKDASGRIYVLSNNHVLADSNNATKGDGILQPGRLDGGRPGVDDIAQLSDFGPIDFSGAANDFDAAIALLHNPLDVESPIIDIGAPGRHPLAAQLYQSVRKHGRTTGHTLGVVVDTSVSLWVGFGNQKAWFQDQLAIQGVGPVHFSAGGDSGSLIVESISLAPLGLLFAGSTSGLTFASPIGPVLTRFGGTID